MNVDIKIKCKYECMPLYASQFAAGADLMADIPEAVVLQPGKRILVPTSVFLEIPSGYEVQIRARSGLAIKHGISVLNGPGTIDSDYRGEIKVILINLGDEPFTITPLMRIAQMVLSPVYQAQFVKANLLTKTQRGESGFGSTGSC